MKTICIIRNSTHNIYNNNSDNNAKKYFKIQKSQRMKTWEFSFKFIIRQKYINLYKNNKIEYQSRMIDFGKWTESNLIALGPTFIKLGQLLSTRRDIFPNEFVEQLQNLQDNVPPMTNDELTKILSRELNADVDSLFKYFEYSPNKSASLGQVHRAVLVSGTRVAVKVRRPNIRDIIISDTENIIEILDILDRVGITTGPSAKQIFSEAREYLFNELDYTLEANNSYVFMKNFKNNPDLITPRVYFSKSTDRLLIMEWVYGIKINDIETLKKNNVDLKRLTKILIETFITQIMDYGFFHADPHPGNISVKIYKDTGDASIVLYDYGLVVKIPEKIKNGLRDILKYIIVRDTKKIVDILIELGLIIPTADKDDIILFFDNILNYLEKLDGNKLNSDLVKDNLVDSLSRQKPFIFPSSFIFLAKSITLIEGICKNLDPEFTYYIYLENIIRDNIMSVIDIEKIASNTLEIPSKIQSISLSVNNLERQRIDLKKKLEYSNSLNRTTQYYILLSFIAQNAITTGDIYDLFLIVLLCLYITFGNNRR